MTINISDKIDKELFERLITFYNTPSREYVIYFSSSGGSTDFADAIIDLINRNIETTTLIAFSCLNSSGFEIFFRAKCKRIILDGCTGMYHQSFMSISINENGKCNYLEDLHHLKYIKAQKEATLEIGLSLGFSAKEMKLLKKGEDIWFQNDRLNELNNKI